MPRTKLSLEFHAVSRPQQAGSCAPVPVGSNVSVRSTVLFTAWASNTVGISAARAEAAEAISASVPAKVYAEDLERIALITFFVVI